MDRLVGPDRSELIEAMADQMVTAKALSAALAKRGHELSYWSIQRHRRGDCKCPC